MIDGTGIFYAERACHDATISGKRGNVNTKDLTLYAICFYMFAGKPYARFDEGGLVKRPALYSTYRFPLKLLYLAMKSISKKWTMPIHDW
jgi:hypothetical protein